MKTKHKFTEPVLISAGSSRIKLGKDNDPPLVDCRLIWEPNYQLLKKCYDMHDEMLEALKMSLRTLRENDVNRNAQSFLVNAIKKASE